MANICGVLFFISLIMKNYISPLFVANPLLPISVNMSGDLWTRDEWSGWHGEYTGSARAGKGASLSSLAYLITRYADDWREISLPEKVEIGQIVYIAPLLRKLEMRLRANVVAATKKFKAVGFPSSNSLSVTVSGSGGAAKALNRYFNSHRKLPIARLLPLASLKKGFWMLSEAISTTY